MNIWRRVWLIWTLLITPYIVASDFPDSAWYFEHISNEDGLSNITVRDIAQDEHGFLWFATDYGLNRFDGYKFKVFLPQKNNPSSLASSGVNTLLLNQNNQLLVGTSNGLQIFDEGKERFIKYANLAQNLISAATISVLFEDQSRTLWVGTSTDGVFRISENREQITQYNASTSSIMQLSSNNITSIVESEDIGLIWIASEKGLNIVGDQLGSKSKDLKNVESAFANQTILSLYMDPKHGLWIGGEAGLALVDTSDFSIRQFADIQLPVRDIAPDAEGRLWLATNKGIGLFEPDTNRFSLIRNDTSDLNSPAGLSFRSVFISADDIVWFGSYDNGVDFFNPNTRKFGHRKSHSDNDQCLSSNLIFSGYIDRVGDIWLGANGKGLNHINRQKQRCRLITGNQVGLTNDAFNYVVDIHEDSNSDLWFATYNQGLVHYQRSSAQFHQYSFKDKSTPISSDFTRTIVEDNWGNIWIGTFYGGLIKFDRQNRSFSTVLRDDIAMVDLQNNIITSMAFDGTHLWLGTSRNGVLKFNPAHHQFEESGLKQHFEFTNINGLVATSDRELWIGTAREGLFRFDHQTQEMRHFTTAEGLSSSLIYQIIADNSGSLWVATASGLSRVNLESFKIDTFNRQDGLQNDEFTNAAAFNEVTGELLFGGIRGINVFNPDDIGIQSIPPGVAITELEIFNKAVSVDSPSDAVLTQNINQTKTLNLDHFHKVFGFEFSGLHFASPDQNKYAYRLLGFEDDWIEVSAERRYVSYSNLPAGNYEFQVKAANKYGVWNQESKKIGINIAQAPWLTWWAFTIYTLILFAIAATIFFLLLRKQRAQQEALAARSLAEAKDRIFANVSHEFKTPLSLIIAPVELMLTGAKDIDERNRLTLVKRHANRLSRMVEQFLELAKLDTAISESKQPIELTALLNSLLASFKPLFEAKNLNCRYAEEKQQIWLMMLPDSLEIILTNLISNAIKYTPEGGEVGIELQLSGNSVKFVISDNGSGINKQDQELIFQRFTRAVDNQVAPTQGTGIGLALTKELVEKNGGEISLKSDVGVGSEFTVVLPVAESEASQQHAEESAAMLPATKTEIAVLADTLPVEGEILASSVGAAEVSTDKSLLIIEDNPDMRALISDIFKGSYKCLYAENGEQGLTIGVEQIPDIIISDLMMPGISGFEVVEQFRENELTSHIPIIMLTAKSDTQSRLKGWEKYVDEYITKPFLPKELQLRVENLLKLRSLVKQQLQKQLLTNEQSEQTSIPSLTEKDQAFIDKFLSVLENNYASPEFDRTTASKAMFVSEKQLSRKLSGLLDTNFTEYLKDFRLQRSVEMFVTGKQVAQIADDTGFSSPSYYIRCFKQKYGMTPNQYRDAQTK